MLRSNVFVCALGAFSTLLYAQPGSGPTSNPSGTANRVSELVDLLGKVQTPITAAISPDATLVAWSYKGERGSELHLTPITGAGGGQDRVLSPDTVADTKRTAAGECTGGRPAWSPDGDRLAFLSNCPKNGARTAEGKQENVWVWTRGSNEVRQISHLRGGISALHWSPDGKSIGFLYVENATRSAGALDAMKPWSGVVGEDGVEVQRIYAVDVASGRGDWVSSSPRLHVYEFAWSPDSRAVVYVAAAPPGENNWWVAHLYTQSVGYIASCGEEGGVSACKSAGAPMGVPVDLLNPQTVAGPLHGMQLAVPRFSPDGKQIAFIGGLMSDQGSTGGDIYVIPAKASGGVAPKDVTLGHKGSPAWLQWTGPETIEFTEHVGGLMHIGFVNPVSGAIDAKNAFDLPGTISADEVASSLSLAKTGEAFILSSYEHAPEVWAGAGSAPRPITHLNDTLRPQWGKAESVEWTNDGFHVQGWLLYPAGYDPAKRYPLIVSVHGGPSSAVTPRWPEAAYGAVPFSALGYFVFQPNPRGSYGQGERFTQANVKDFGHGDLRDVLAGMDLIEKRFPIDKAREGLTGWSYGGFMTMFGVTQTTRFKAAVAGAGIANWQSYYGENSIDQWMVPFFGATVYDDPAVYAKSSAIEFIKKVKTPTLVVVGDRDGECPAPQSFEFWHALREEGVKTQLVVYPAEGHHFVDPAHKKDVLRRALEWFDTQMPAARP
ncbi:MAG: hypothetical protein NVSMB62_24190 [Acidobacteriaceae bacterium]